MNASRALPVLLLPLLLTACGPAPSLGSQSTTTSPPLSGAATAPSLTTPAPPALPAVAATDSSAAAPIPATPPASAGLNVVHAPRRVFDDAHLQAGQCHLRQAAAGPLPDPACTPGAIDPAVNQSNIKTTICSPGYTGTVRPPASDTDRWKRITESAYAVPSGEYDHLVPLELGGANATSNLWVEPGAIPNPKDRVENRLRSEVCAGQLTLAQAQQSIATDWTAAP